MERLQVLSPAGHKWMREKDPKNWSRSHFRTYPKCDMLLNNMCESFNGAILEAREKPLIPMMETVREYIMERMAKKRAEAEKWT